MQWAHFHKCMNRDLFLYINTYGLDSTVSDKWQSPLQKKRTTLGPSYTADRKQHGEYHLMVALKAAKDKFRAFF